MFYNASSESTSRSGHEGERAKKAGWLRNPQASSLFSTVESNVPSSSSITMVKLRWPHARKPQAELKVGGTVQRTRQSNEAVQ